MFLFLCVDVSGCLCVNFSRYSFKCPDHRASREVLNCIEHFENYTKKIIMYDSFYFLTDTVHVGDILDTLRGFLDRANPLVDSPKPAVETYAKLRTDNVPLGVMVDDMVDPRYTGFRDSNLGEFNDFFENFSTSDGLPKAHNLVGGNSDLGALQISQVTYETPDKGALSTDELASVISTALDKQEITDPTLRTQWGQVLTLIAENESSLVPSAINTWDINYAGDVVSDGYKGQASRGVFQMVPQTFASYHEPGTSTSVYDPLSQACAVVNYLKDVYGVADSGEGLRSFYEARSVRYFGY